MLSSQNHRLDLTVIITKASPFQVIVRDAQDQASCEGMKGEGALKGSYRLGEL